GDTIECCDDEGRLLVNGEPVDESDYLHSDVAPSDVPFSVEVPEDHYWVMGDNRSNSLDSRYNMDSAGGPYIPEEGIVGEVFVINWPMDRLRWMGGAEPAFDTVPDTPAG